MADLKQFLELVHGHQNMQQPTVDWGRRKEKWLRELDNLFKFIQKTLIEANYPGEKIKIKPHQIVERNLGTYCANEMIINWSDGVDIKLIPKGTMVLGGYGRVDVLSNLPQRILLVAVSADGNESANISAADREWKWEIISGNGKVTPFNFEQSSLIELIGIIFKIN
jgi:hypothetical protein